MKMKRRGSRKGVKRGPYKKRKPRRYPGPHKTTTKAGKREYQRYYMRERKRVELGISPNRFGVRGPKPKRILAKQVIQPSNILPYSPYLRAVRELKKQSRRKK